MRKAIVYGGSGFLGSHVADALLESGLSVRIFDAKPSPYLQEGQEMVTGDILDPEAVARAAQGCAYVYNFAAIADIDEARVRPVDTLRVNILGTANCLEAARQCGANRFVLASTVYVYSRSGSFYRVSKQACEQLVETYREEFGLDYTILRYGSLYGRRADERNAIWRFLHSALMEKHLTYGGTGDELREYIHVSDAARLSVEALSSAYANMPLILTGHHPMRVRDVMRMVQEILGGDIKIEFSNKPVSGHYLMTPYSYHPQIGKKLVGNLYTDMGQGLMDCIAEMSARLPHRPHSPRKARKS